jgi:hypothetical protein
MDLNFEFWNNSFTLASFNFIFSNGYKAHCLKLSLYGGRIKESIANKANSFNLIVQSPETFKAVIILFVLHLIANEAQTSHISKKVSHQISRPKRAYRSSISMLSQL